MKDFSLSDVSGARTDAPLYRALTDAARRDAARFHMPGHKGRPLPGGLWGGMTELDVTELSYSGNLYTETDGPIREAERALAALYGAASAMLLTGGATQGVLSMLAACTTPGDTVIVHRNAHRSVFHALALLDLHPRDLFCGAVSPFGVEDGVDPVCLEEALREAPHARAVVITSPSYYGVLTDIAALAPICKRYGVKLLVDAAHGAHVPFAVPPDDASELASGGEACHPLVQGADVAVFSAHKTLRALGQSAFLLHAETVDADRLRAFTSVFGTSSPSYLLMASVDIARAGLAGEDREGWTRAAGFGCYLRKKYTYLLSNRHLRSGRSEPCRLCLYTGDGYGDALRLERERALFCEMADRTNLVLILSSSDPPDWWERLEQALSALPVRQAPPPQAPPPPVRLLTPRQALFAQAERLPLGQCAGRITCEPIAPYPPGVPLVAAGEKIDKIHLEILGKLCYTMDEPTRVVK